MEDTFKFMTIKTKHIYESYKSCTQMSEVKHFSTIHFESVKKGDGGGWGEVSENASINTVCIHFKECIQLFSRMDIKGGRGDLSIYRVK